MYTSSINPSITTLNTPISLNPVAANFAVAATDFNSLNYLQQSVQAGTIYTLALSDATTTIDFSNSGSVAVTIPANATVAFPIGTQISICQYGAGTVTVSGAVGVTLRTPSVATTSGQYATIGLRQRAINEWILSGNL